MRVLLLASTAVLIGCAGRGGVEPTRRLEPVSTAEPERPPALLNGDPIRWGELTPAMSEAQGRAALEEIALTRLLRGELARAGLSIAKSDVDRERKLLLASLGGGDEAGTALERVRERRGLGPTRFAALLERNAMLRKLVAGEVAPTAEQIDLAARVALGPRLRVRMILVGTEGEAATIRGRITERSGEARTAWFAFEAVEHSLDESAARGGRVEALSVDDPSWPEALRRTAAATAPGEVSPIVALEQGAALVLVEERLPGEPASPEERARIEREVRLRLERSRMDALAASLISGADLVVFDEGLRWSREHR